MIRYDISNFIISSPRFPSFDNAVKEFLSTFMIMCMQRLFVHNMHYHGYRVGKHLRGVGSNCLALGILE